MFYLCYCCRLYRNLTLVADEPEKVYPTAGDIWRRFVLVYRSISGLLMYAPVSRAYLYQTLQEFRDDGVQYIELRTTLMPVCTRFVSCLFMLAIHISYLEFP